MKQMSDSASDEEYPCLVAPTAKLCEPRFAVKAEGAMPVIRYFEEQDRLQVCAMDPADSKVYKWCKIVPGVTVAHGGGIGRKRPRQEVCGLVWDDKLYHAVASITETPVGGHHLLIRTDDVWFGADDDTLLGPNKLLIRDWHKALWERYSESIASNFHQVVIVGTPGTGKSVSLNYILWKYLTAPKAVQKKRYVALILPNSGSYYLFDTQDKVACREDLTAFSKNPVEKDVLVLHDLVGDAPLTSRALPTVLATRSNAASCHEFTKVNRSYCFYVPFPTDAEMDFMATHLIPSDHNYDRAWEGVSCKSWREVAYFYGNVPRLVFGRRSQHDAIVYQLGSLDLGRTKTCPYGPEVYPWLLEYVPTQHYTRWFARFRQGYVTVCIADKLHAWLDGKWEKIVRFGNHGHVFEGIAHEALIRHPEGLPGFRLDENWFNIAQ